MPTDRPIRDRPITDRITPITDPGTDHQTLVTTTQVMAPPIPEA